MEQILVFLEAITILLQIAKLIHDIKMAQEISTNTKMTEDIHRNVFNLTYNTNILLNNKNNHDAD
jgi:hypothetical protein